MTAKRTGLIVLVVALLLVANASAEASGRWTNIEQWFARASGGNPMGLVTGMDSVIVVDEGGSISKNSAFSLNAFGVNQVQLKSLSSLQTFSGGHASVIENGISQTYNLPNLGSIAMSQTNTVSGFPENPTSAMSAQMSILGSNGNPLMTFYSSMDDDSVAQSVNGDLTDEYDIDTIVNNALAEMGFTMTIDDFESLTLGSVQYSIEHKDYDRGITSSWGETKNLEVKMDK